MSRAPRAAPRGRYVPPGRRKQAEDDQKRNEPARVDEWGNQDEPAPPPRVADQPPSRRQAPAARGGRAQEQPQPQQQAENSNTFKSNADEPWEDDPVPVYEREVKQVENGMRRMGLNNKEEEGGGGGGGTPGRSGIKTLGPSPNKVSKGVISPPRPVGVVIDPKRQQEIDDAFGIKKEPATTEHVLEVYGFPPTLAKYNVTQFLERFGTLQTLEQIDECAYAAVFESAAVADAALKDGGSALFKLRRFGDSALTKGIDPGILPQPVRVKKDATIAARFVAGHLGLRMPRKSKQDREAEKQKEREARASRRAGKGNNNDAPAVPAADQSAWD